MRLSAYRGWITGVLDPALEAPVLPSDREPELAVQPTGPPVPKSDPDQETGTTIQRD